MEQDLYEKMKNNEEIYGGGGGSMKRKPKQSSLDSYHQKLRFLNNNIIPTDYKFLNNYDEIMKKIDHFKPNTQRNYIIAIVSILRNTQNDALYNGYSKIMDKYNRDLKTSNTKSETQLKNWIPQTRVQDIYDILYDRVIPNLKSKGVVTSEMSWNDITELMLLSLYVLQPPRRIVDYMNMFIVKKLPKVMDKDQNYCDVSSGIMYFNCYKTSGTYHTQEVKISPKLMDIILLYIKKLCSTTATKLNLNSKLPLLCTYNGMPIKRGNIITLMLNKIFGGLKISVSMLRNIYLTDKFAPITNDMDTTAHDMGTSSGTIQNSYVKKD